MRNKIRSFLRDLRGCTSGNAMMLVGLAMPMLIGGAGVGIDFSQWYLWKRELQLATDQAAVSAAWARAFNSTQSSYQTRGSQDYYANLAMTASFASAPSFSLANYANGSNNSVIVTASATRALPFSSFLTGRSATVSAISQASYAPGGSYNACLIATGSSGTTLSVGGSATVTAHCGMAALSCSSNAINIDGAATVIADSIAACGTITAPAANATAVTENVGGLRDTNSDLNPPDNTTPRTYQCTGNGNRAQASILPGTYNGGLVLTCTTVLSAGIYVINGGSLDLTGNFSVTGTNVMFVLKGGATLKLGGSGNGNTLTLTPMQASDFVSLGYSTTLSNRYANMLIFEARDNNPTQSHIINGNSNSLIQGTVYLPKGDVRINGTADINSSCLQLTANTITILGNADVETRCSTAQTNSAGSSTPTVRLVA